MKVFRSIVDKLTYDNYSISETEEEVNSIMVKYELYYDTGVESICETYKDLINRMARRIDLQQWQIDEARKQLRKAHAETNMVKKQINESRLNAGSVTKFIERRNEEINEVEYENETLILENEYLKKNIELLEHKLAHK